MKTLFYILLTFLLSSCSFKTVKYSENKNNYKTKNNSIFNEANFSFPMQEFIPEKDCLDRENISDDEIEVFYRDNKTDFKNKNDTISYSDFVKQKLAQKYGDYQYIIIKKNLKKGIDSIIYISTTPSATDISFRNYFLDSCKTVPNSYYFNTFLIGKLVKNSKDNFDKIVFQDDKRKINWIITLTENNLMVNEIDIYNKKYRNAISFYKNTLSTENALDIGFSFKKIVGFKGFYYSADNREKNRYFESPRVEKFVFQFNDKQILKKILVVYNKSLPNKINSDAEEYSKSRIKYYQIEK